MFNKVVVDLVFIEKNNGKYNVLNVLDNKTLHTMLFKSLKRHT
jgi:hypothetical protein